MRFDGGFKNQITQTLRYIIFIILFLVYERLHLVLLWLQAHSNILQRITAIISYNYLNFK